MRNVFPQNLNPTEQIFGNCKYLEFLLKSKLKILEHQFKKIHLSSYKILKHNFIFSLKSEKILFLKVRKGTEAQKIKT